MQTAIASTLSEQDQALRAGRFTSTRVVQLVKGNALKVWLDMTGQGSPIPDNARMRWGRRLERVIIEAAAEEQGWGSVVYQPGTRVSERNPLFATSVDAIADDEIAVEAKNRGGERSGEYACNEPLEDEIVQVTWHQHVLGLTKGRVCVLLGGNDLRVFPVDYDADTAAGLEELCLRFKRDHLDTGKPPPLDGSDAAADYLKRRFPTHRASLREDPEAEALVRSYREACAAADSAEEAKKRIGNLLRERIGDAEGIAGQGWRATWKASKGSKVTLWEEAAAEMGAYLDAGIRDQIINRCTTERPGSRRLLVTVKE